jgi:hypothetical protein
MTPLDDELAMRGVLTDLTAGQPPAPPGRSAAVRDRARARRRRQLAGVAAAVAVLVAAAIAVPLGVLHAGPTPPSAPRHYRVSENPPRPGAPRGLIATGRAAGVRWSLSVQLQQHGSLMCWLLPGREQVCDGGGADQAKVSRTGDPAWISSGGGPGFQIYGGWVRADVTRLAVTYSNGQVLSLRPVDVLGRRYARFFALAGSPRARVTQVAAYSADRELGYAIPFTAADSVDLVRWLRPGQPALPRPVARVIGSGNSGGPSWTDHLYIGPWGTCVDGTNDGSLCWPSTGWLPGSHGVIGSMGLSAIGNSIFYEHCQAVPAVSYVVITRADGSTERIAAIQAGPWKYLSYASVQRDKVVRWAAFGAHGQELASGSGQAP